ncbi:hypothetical protein TNCV_1359261 [Trichonephila clavipes]|nr:hypothetical protein TNCV_1359261 [Trichonephila clavipes]
MSQKKTEMTNVSMRIILKDDIPVYQPARRLSFSENQDVNKQIDEWLEQGIAEGMLLWKRFHLCSTMDRKTFAKCMHNLSVKNKEVKKKMLEMSRGLVLDFEVLSKYCHNCVVAGRDMGVDWAEFHIWQKKDMRMSVTKF